VSSNARAHAALSAGSAIRIWVRLVALSSIVLPAGAAANPIPPDPSDVLAVQDSGRTGWSLPVSFSCLRSCLRTRGDHHHGLLGPHTYTEPSVIPLSSVRSRLKAVRLRASSSRTSCTGACSARMAERLLQAHQQRSWRGGVPPSSAPSAPPGSPSRPGTARSPPCRSSAPRWRPTPRWRSLPVPAPPRAASEISPSALCSGGGIITCISSAAPRTG
jgi:hypothetical protein